jgi:uncharacterized protein
MPKTLTQILKEVWEEKRDYFERYQFYGKKIKKEAEKILGSVRVLIFGSIIKNEWSPQSDIDVLIISENLPENQEERSKIRTKIKSSIDPFSPFQIHLVTRKEYQNWYQRFIKKDFVEI